MVLLSKKTPISVGFFWFKFWDTRDREKVKSETVKMGGELGFILRSCPNYVIRKLFCIFGFCISKGYLVIFAGRVRRA